jgi:hypothetical protein
MLLKSEKDMKERESFCLIDKLALGVKFNYISNNLLYAGCASSPGFCFDIYIFPPIMKFISSSGINHH